MQELEVVLLQGEVAVAGVEARGVVGVREWGRPEDVVVVGKEGEEDAEEEACCCRLRLGWDLGTYLWRL